MNHKEFYDYVKTKIDKLNASKVSFASLFERMFCEKDEILAERMEGFSLVTTTYGEAEKAIKRLALVFENEFSHLEKGTQIGISMANSVEWIEIFWATLMSGFRPVLINTRLPASTLEELFASQNVGAVITDSVTYAIPTVTYNFLLEKCTEQESEGAVWGEEVLFMTSGTTDNLKLCAYNAANFYHQIQRSCLILKSCPQIGAHYEGRLKQLAILPFHHVFGFIAVYLWFTFFSRTLVFLADNHPHTILKTIRAHKVTHIFSVPLLFERLYKEVKKKVKLKGEKTYASFKKAIKTCANGGIMAKIVGKKAFADVRQNTFGESVQFLISGGSAIKESTLRFFNAIGYHATTGYGMTEVGVTSVSTSMKAKDRNGCSVGFPLAGEYRIDENGELLIRGGAMASRIISRYGVTVTNYDDWFNSHDLARLDKDGYHILGRKDDLIVCKNGENLNPELIERLFESELIENVCLFSSDEPTLIVRLKSCYSELSINRAKDYVSETLSKNHLRDEIKHIFYTTDALVEVGEFKKSRRRIAKKFARGEFSLILPDNLSQRIDEHVSELCKQIVDCFADALQKPYDEICAAADFFTDLGGTSLDYFSLVDIVKERHGVDITAMCQGSLSVNAVCEYIKLCEK